MPKDLLKKAGLFFDLKFLNVMHRLNYKYYAKHYPLYLQKMGVKFSGDISKTGFIAGNVKFDSVAYANRITIGEQTTISTGVSINHVITIFIALFGGWIWEKLGIETLFVLSAVLGLCNSAYAATVKTKKQIVS